MSDGAGQGGKSPTLGKKEIALRPLQLGLASLDDDLRFAVEFSVTVRRRGKDDVRAAALTYGHVLAVADEASRLFRVNRTDAAKTAVEAALAKRPVVARGLEIRRLRADFKPEVEVQREVEERIALETARELAGSAAVAEVVRAKQFHSQIFSDPGRLASHLLLSRPDIEHTKLAGQIVGLVRELDGIRPDGPSIRIAEVLYEFARGRSAGERHDLLQVLAQIASGFNGGTARDLLRLAEEFAGLPRPPSFTEGDPSAGHTPSR
jgi:hypothetical protein